MGKYNKKGLKEKDLKSPISSKTIFVQNIPFEATNETLLDVFKAYGPIHSCFVVNDTISKKSRGIGYVKFADSDDAAKALQSVKNIDGRKVSIAYANSKKPSDEPKLPCKQIKAPAAHKLIIRNLPFSSDETQLKELFSTFGEVADAQIPTGPNGKPKGYGFVSFTQKDSGVDAIASMNHKKLEGRQLSLEWFLKTSDYRKQSTGINSSSTTAVKSSSDGGHRLIIRNLPFQMTVDGVKKSLSQFGQVEKVDIPLTKDGKKRGFSFATFSTRESAEKTISELKELNKRPVAVDWAVDKSTYLSNLTKSENSSSPAKPSQSSGKKLHSSSQEPKSNSSPTKSKNNSKTMPKKALAPEKDSEAVLRDDLESESGSEDVLENESGSEDDIDMESGSEDNLKSDPECEDDLEDESGSEDDTGMKSESEDDLENESGADDETQSESDEDESENDDVSKGHKSKKKIKGTKANKRHQTSSADITQDRTLFLRNVGYDTTEEQLREAFAEFGDVSYVKLLVNPMTERSKGMAFVQYKKKDQADKCLQAAEDDQQKSMFVVDGRELSVALAVSREKITELTKAKEKQPKDKRNLYLAREGLIRQGTQAAEGVSSTDMNKRVKLETTMRAKLKNPLIFISPTRICVHNLPTKLDDKKLKSLCLTSAQDKSAKIIECRIIRDLANVNAEGVGKSRGFSFVEFTEHSHALAALRQLNNNPEIFTNVKRPIAEFSLENTKALQAKERRLQTVKSTLTGNTKNSVNADKTKLATKGSEMQIERPKGVKPGLPSHHGAKIRHKPRPTTTIDAKKEARLTKKRKERELSRQEKEDNKQPKPKKKKIDMPDSFDKLVSSYRDRMSAGVNTKAKAKWFE